MTWTQTEMAAVTTDQALQVHCGWCDAPEGTPCTVRFTNRSHWTRAAAFLDSRRNHIITEEDEPCP